MIVNKFRKIQLKEYIRVGSAALGKEVLLSPPLPRIPPNSPSQWFDIHILTEKTKARRLEFAKFVIFYAAKAYRLEMPRLFVKFSKLKDHAGHVFMRDGNYYVEIDQSYHWKNLSICSIVAHEIAHVVLGQKNVTLQPTIRNEELTDTVAILAGFGKCMIAACLQRQTSVPHLFLGVVSTRVHRLGYLSRSELSFVSKMKYRIAREKIITRWSQIDSQNMLSIPCYACNTKLRAPPKTGLFILRCPICHMKQKVTLKFLVTNNLSFFEKIGRLNNKLLGIFDAIRGLDKISYSNHRIYDSKARGTWFEFLNDIWRKINLNGIVALIVFMAIIFAFLFLEDRHQELKSSGIMGYQQTVEKIEREAPPTATKNKQQPARNNVLLNHGAPLNSKTSIPQQIPVFNEPPQLTPTSGTGFNVSFYKKSAVAPFKIITPPDGRYNYCIKIVNAKDKQPIAAYFIRAGERLNVDVPLGTYEIKIAIGYIWYGFDYLFGPETGYSKLGENIDFISQHDNNGIVYKGHIIELMKQKDGNLKEVGITKTQW